MNEVMKMNQQLNKYYLLVVLLINHSNITPQSLNQIYQCYLLIKKHQSTIQMVGFGY